MEEQSKEQPMVLFTESLEWEEWWTVEEHRRARGGDR